MEIENEVISVQVDFKCPECETGYLRPTGKCHPMNPPLYPHQCNNPNCKYGESFSGKSYPYITHKIKSSS